MISGFYSSNIQLADKKHYNTGVFQTLDNISPGDNIQYTQ